MRALIIDDEPPVITVVRLLVDWDKYGITEVFSAASAEEGLSVIGQMRPEIILSDINLPDMNGLDLIEKLQDGNPQAQIIIISAFDKFSYAQRAVELGCVEYLLKPLKRERINNAVEKAVRKYREAHEVQSDSQMTRIQSLLSLYLGAEHLPELYQEMSRIAPWIGGWKRIVGGVIPMGYLPHDAPSLLTIQEAAYRFAAEERLGAAAVWGNSSDIVLFLNGDAVGLEGRCTRFLEQIRDNLGLKLYMGLSEPMQMPDQLDSAYLMAQEAAVSANLLKDGCVIRSSAIPATRAVSFSWAEEILFVDFPREEPEKIRANVRNFCLRFLEPGYISLRQIENLRTFYNNTRNRRIQNLLAEHHITVFSPLPAVESLCLADGSVKKEALEEMLITDMLTQRAYCLEQIAPSSISEVIEQVQTYLWKHHQETISMEDIARKFGVSFSHLSRTFKKEVGVGMNEYLTHIRIEKAAALLREGGRPSDVSLEAGFLDPKYFSRVFRKEMDMTPSEYRKVHFHGDGNS